MKRITLVFMALMLAGGFVLGDVGSSLAKPVKFKLVTFFRANTLEAGGIKLFMEMVNKKFKDDIEIEWVGGPEVIPMFQQHEAVKKGVIDMCLTSSTFYPSHVYESKSLMFTNKSYKEIIETKYFDLMRPVHEKVGFIYLGSCNIGEPFHIFANFKIEKLNDLSGKKYRVFPAFIPLIKALGGVPVNLPIGDIYTAMERGAVDGFVMTHFGFVKDFSWHEVTKYVLDYDIYSGSTALLVNPKKWNKLSPDVQKGIWEYKTTAVDPLIADYFKDHSAAEWDSMISKGVKPVTFSSPADGEKFLKIAYDAAWEDILKKSPELGPKIKTMLVK